jgi:kynureninase
MGPVFEKAAGIRGFQIATPPIMGMRSVKSGFTMISRAGISEIAKKAALGTQLMIDLHDAWLAPLGVQLQTPRTANERGGHVSLMHPDAAQICLALRKISNVFPDFRAPNSIRLAISPLPTSYVEVWDGFDRLRDLVASGRYKEVAEGGSRVT